MDLRIKEIQSRDQWEGFMALCKPQTFLHSWAWGEFNEKIGTNVFRYGLYDGDKLCAVALVLLIKARRGAFLFCPHGPTVLEEASKADVMLVLTNYMKSLAREKKCAFLRFSPLFENTAENEKIFGALKYRQAPIHMQHPELSWILDLTPGEDQLLMDMRKTTRYCIKKAQKDGVVIESSADPDDVDIFWKVYEETFGRQNFTPFSREYLRTEMEIFGKDDGVLLFFGKYNEEVVATAIVVFYKNSAFYHHAASSHKYPKITAPYLLQWAVIQEAKRRNCQWYNFWGIVPEEQKNHPWAGLSLFKKGFGGFSQSYVHAKDLVLTPKYWLSYMVETIRRKKRRL